MADALGVTAQLKCTTHCNRTIRRPKKFAKTICRGDSPATRCSQFLRSRSASIRLGRRLLARDVMTNACLPFELEPHIKKYNLFLFATKPFMLGFSSFSPDQLQAAPTLLSPLRTWVGLEKFLPSSAPPTGFRRGGAKTSRHFIELTYFNKYTADASLQLFPLDIASLPPGDLNRWGPRGLQLHNTMTP